MASGDRRAVVAAGDRHAAALALEKTRNALTSGDRLFLESSTWWCRLRGRLHRRADLGPEPQVVCPGRWTSLLIVAAQALGSSCQPFSTFAVVNAKVAEFLVPPALRVTAPSRNCSCGRPPRPNREAGHQGADEDI